MLDSESIKSKYLGFINYCVKQLRGDFDLAIFMNLFIFMTK